MARRVLGLNKISLISIIILLLGCKQPEQKNNAPSTAINLANVNFSTVNGLAEVNGQPFSGSIFMFYPNTKDTAEIRNYLSGKENGEWRKYYTDGKLREKRYFDNGFKTGEDLVWWPNGNKQQQYFFVNDVYEGTCFEWTQNGLLLQEMHYEKGYEQGPQKAWWNNGKIKANYIIKDGRRYGLLGTKRCINVSDSVFKK